MSPRTSNSMPPLRKTLVLETDKSSRGGPHREDHPGRELRWKRRRSDRHAIQAACCCCGGCGLPTESQGEKRRRGAVPLDACCCFFVTEVVWLFEKSDATARQRSQTCFKRRAVLAAVKTAARRLRRWPAASLDRRYTRRVTNPQAGAEKRRSNRTEKRLCACRIGGSC